MPTPCRRVYAATACLLAAVLLTASQASGQFTSVHAPDRSVRGESINVFASWAGDEPGDAILVELPSGWSLDSATVMRNGYQRVPAQTFPAEGIRYRVVPSKALDAPHDVVLHVRPGDGYAQDRIVLTPLKRSGGEYVQVAALRAERRMVVVDPPTSRTNRAVSFGAPFALLPARTPDLSLDRTYVASFWMKTSALREVVLSTWNGDDRRMYPLEVVVDGTGHLRAYRGRPGAHQSLGSRRPVADGSWHFVSIVNHPDDGWARLSVDGRTVDSLYTPTPPRIAMELPLVLGGRADGAAPYFDGMEPFSGWIDELHLDPRAEEALQLDFEEEIPTDLAAASRPEVRYEWAGRRLHDEIHDFQSVPDPNGVTLTWSAPEASARVFVVERSYDGHAFEEIERLEASATGSYRVFDDHVEDRLVFYRLRQLTPDGGEVLSGTLRVGLGANESAAVVLLGNFPNPFNATTTITYEVYEAMRIQLAIWDLSGQPVATLVDQTQNPGVYEARFDAADLPSGTYFVRLRTPSRVISHKMILMK